VYAVGHEVEDGANRQSNATRTEFFYGKVIRTQRNPGGNPSSAPKSACARRRGDMEIENVGKEIRHTGRNLDGHVKKVRVNQIISISISTI
jgi:hypothetical protein